MFDKKAHNLIVEKAHKSKVDHTSNMNKIAHVPARVNHSSVPGTDTDRRPRVNQNTNKTPHVPARGDPKCERKPAEMTIPSPLSHFPNGTIIYKLFNKEYWKARVIRYNTKNAYYTIQYNDNDEEELTHEEINAYLIPSAKGEYWTEQQSGRRRSKRIEKNKIH